MNRLISLHKMIKPTLFRGEVLSDVSTSSFIYIVKETKLMYVIIEI